MTQYFLLYWRTIHYLKHNHDSDNTDNTNDDDENILQIRLF